MFDRVLNEGDVCEIECAEHGTNAFKNINGWPHRRRTTPHKRDWVAISGAYGELAAQGQPISNGEASLWWPYDL
jgi:hypothetical protein